jgi:ribonucleotide reductase alpha subunit
MTDIIDTTPPLADAEAIRIADGPGPQGVGLITFLRTYARHVVDGDESSPLETYAQTIDRVLLAAQTQLKCGFTDDELREFRYLLMNMKCMPAGRFLWQLGTKTVDKYGLLSLQNCASVALRRNNVVEAFCWMFDALCLGVGVGFNIEDSTIAGMSCVYAFTLIHIHEKPSDTYSYSQSQVDGVMPFNVADDCYMIGDSREGWTDTIRQVLSRHLGGCAECHTFTINSWFVRPRGSMIKGFGGKASGHETFTEGLFEINHILNLSIGRPPSALTLLDVANWLGHIVVSGNVRRSAELALGSAENEEYLGAKNWASGAIPYSRSNSNNSVVVSRTTALPDAFWDGYRGDAEPYGLVNLDLYRSVGQINGGGAFEKPNPEITCVNPCVTGETWTLTTQGPRRVIDLVGVDGLTLIVNGVSRDVSSRGFFASGVKSTLKLKTRFGVSVVATEDHEFIGSDGEWRKLKDFSVGDLIQLQDHHNIMQDLYPINGLGYLTGHLIGDGTFTSSGQAVLSIWNKSAEPSTYALIQETMMKNFSSRSDFAGWYSVAGRNESRISNASFTKFLDSINIRRYQKTSTDALEMMPIEFQANVIRGLFDSDGTVSGDLVKGCSVRFSNCDYNLIAYVYRTLQRIGIFSKIYDRAAPMIKDMPDGKGGSKGYNCKQLYEVCISGESIARFERMIGFIHDEKALKLRTINQQRKRAYNRSSVFAAIESIEPSGDSPVFDVSVNSVHCFDANGFTAHNCGEQGLEDFETCCLGEIVPCRCVDEREFRRCVYFIYRLCKHSLALPCHWQQTHEVVSRNMRMGIGVTGVMEMSAEQRLWLKPTARWLDVFDRDVYSPACGFPTSKRLRTVKPSGTLSILAGVTAGAHPAEDYYYLKRMRIASDSPLLAWLRVRGYHIEPLEYMVTDEDSGRDLVRYDSRTMVVDFPMSHGDSVVTLNEMTAIDQIKIIQWLQEDWSDNGVSVTVKYRPEELWHVKEYLKLYYKTSIKAISFLLRSNHGFRQAPWTPITHQEWLTRVKCIEEATCLVSVSALTEQMKALSNDELANEQDDDGCVNGVCPRR